MPAAGPGAWTVGVLSGAIMSIHRVGLVEHLPVGAPFPARVARYPPRGPGFA
jgi:hypothetical protein